MMLCLCACIVAHEERVVHVRECHGAVGTATERCALRVPHAEKVLLLQALAAAAAAASCAAAFSQAPINNVDAVDVLARGRHE